MSGSAMAALTIDALKNICMGIHPDIAILAQLEKFVKQIGVYYTHIRLTINDISLFSLVFEVI